LPTLNFIATAQVKIYCGPGLTHFLKFENIKAVP